MELQFDEHGLITPKEIIELSLVDFERIFVKERKEKAHRQKIFDEYLKHNKTSLSGWLTITRQDKLKF